MNIILCLTMLSMMKIVVAYTDAKDMKDKALLTDPKEVRTLLDCYLDNIQCPPRYVPYRKHAEQAIEDACHECSSIQKHYVHMFIQECKRLYPEDYKLLVEKYDKEGTHFNALLVEVYKF